MLHPAPQKRAWTHDTNRSQTLSRVEVNHKERAVRGALECAAGCKIVTVSACRVWSCTPAGRAHERLFASRALFPSVHRPVGGRGADQTGVDPKGAACGLLRRRPGDPFPAQVRRPSSRNGRPSIGATSTDAACGIPEALLNDHHPMSKILRWIPALAVSGFSKTDI